MPWELFKKPGRYPSSSEPGLTISRKGSVLINSIATERYFSTARFVEVYYDKETGRIALKPAEQGGPGAFAVRQPKGTQHTLFTMLSFLKWNNLVADHSRRYTLTEEGGLLVLTPLPAPKRR